MNNMKYASPESKGISSANIKKYIDILEEHNLSTHNVIIARGEDIVYEKYWDPFGPDYLHRQYSVSKSFVSLAVGFAEQDGLLSLDEPMIKHFPEELENQPDENLRNQTVRHMLMMCTAKGGGRGPTPETTDRVRHYFENDSMRSCPSGKLFDYDSPGSFILGALVERLTGKPFMEYLREKMFDKIGVSKEAYCLKSAGGHSWGDSAVLCTARDLLLVARFCLNNGAWNGEQILNKDYVIAATSKQVDNNIQNRVSLSNFGYGYLFWRTYDNSYFMNGMGCQFAICVPDKDIIMIYNGDNQGLDDAKEIVIGNFFRHIVRTAEENAIQENPGMLAQLTSAKFKLRAAKGNAENDFAEKINGKVFVANENPMGITKFSLHFGKGKGTFQYTNAQGDKEFDFGICENVFGHFPQEGYGNEVTMQPTSGYLYKCAASAAWTDPQKLYMNVQIIDKYFGRLHIVFGFADENNVAVQMMKTAEYFLDEYEGWLGAKAE